MNWYKAERHLKRIFEIIEHTPSDYPTQINFENYPPRIKVEVWVQGQGLEKVIGGKPCLKREPRTDELDRVNVFLSAIAPHCHQAHFKRQWQECSGGYLVYKIWPDYKYFET